MPSKSKIDKNFVSEIDQFLAEFDATHPKSASQLAEIKKYEKIYQLRDYPQPKSKDESIWKELEEK